MPLFIIGTSSIKEVNLFGWNCKCINFQNLLPQITHGR